MKPATQVAGFFDFNPFLLWHWFGRWNSLISQVVSVAAVPVFLKRGLSAHSTLVRPQLGSTH
jgi:hypothetical protein